MGLIDYVITAAFIGTCITMILYVVFGQVTVRRLRKNPDTRSALGLEFASGWDIVNVAQAFALPASVNKFLEDSPLGQLNADSSILIKHTSRFERLLGAAFYWSMMLTFVILILMLFV